MSFLKLSSDEMIEVFINLPSENYNNILCNLKDAQKDLDESKPSERKISVNISNLFNHIGNLYNSKENRYIYFKAKAYIESFKPTYHLDQFPDIPIYQEDQEDQEELANPTLRGELTIGDINRWMLAAQTYLGIPAATDDKVETEYSINLAPYGIDERWGMTDNAGEGSCLIHAFLMAASPNYCSHSVSNIQRGILGRAFRQKVYAEMYRDDDRRIITPSDYTVVKKHIYVDATTLYNGEYKVLARKYIEYVGGVRQGIFHPFLDDKDVKQLAVWFNINILILTRNPLDTRYFQFNSDTREFARNLNAGLTNNGASNIIIFHSGNHYITIHKGKDYLFTFEQINPIISLHNERLILQDVVPIRSNPGVNPYKEAIKASILNKAKRDKEESNEIAAATKAIDNAVKKQKEQNNALPVAFSSLGSRSAKSRSSRRTSNALPAAFSSLNPKSGPISYPTSIVTSPLAPWHKTGSAVGILPSRSLFEPSPKPLPAPSKSLQKPLPAPLKSLQKPLPAPPKSLQKPPSASLTPLPTPLPESEEISYLNPMRSLKINSKRSQFPIKSSPRPPPRPDPLPKPKSCVGRFCEFISFKKTRKGGKRMKRRQTKRRYK
jgi:hypothetical protein